MADDFDDDRPSDPAPRAMPSDHVLPPLPSWTANRAVAALHDALAHVMADALSLTALASFARWNVADTASGRFVEVIVRRVRAGRRAEALIARRMRLLGGPVALHPSDASEIPRWTLAGRSSDPVAELVLMMAGTHEFVRSVEAAAEVARDVPDRACMQTLRRLQRREESALAMLRDLASAAAEARAQPAAWRH